MKLKSEQTSAGSQTLIPGVSPLSVERVAMAKLIKERKAKRDNLEPGGMFDTNARAQTDLTDFISEKVIFVHVK